MVHRSRLDGIIEYGRLGVRRRITSAVAAVALAAGCNYPPPPTTPPAPNIRSVPQTFLEGLIVRKKIGGLALQIYNTGRVKTRGGAVSSIKSWEAKVQLDVPAFLIRHPKEGLILFDTGLSTETAARLNRGWIPDSWLRFISQPGEDVVSQMKAGGNDPKDVRWIILSHLHLDHAGLIYAFPQATLVVSKQEWDGQKARQSKRKDSREFDPSLCEGRFQLRLIDFEGAPIFGAFDHAVDMFSDGAIYLIDLAGHTEGSMGAWISLDGGPALLAGDSAYIVDNYMEPALPTSMTMQNSDEYWRKVNMLHAMQGVLPRLVIFPGHDLTPLTLANRSDLPLAIFTTRK